MNMHRHVEWFVMNIVIPVILTVLCLALMATPFAAYYDFTHPKPVVKPPPPICNCVCPPPMPAECPHVP